MQGAAIEYRWIGHGSGPVIILLHEGLGCVTTWRDFPDRISEATGLRCLVYSRWGYGGSDPRPLPWPIDHMEEEGELRLPGLLDALEVGDHVLWGHSDGATVALVSAGHHDDPRLRGIVSVAAHVFAGEPTGTASINRARQRYGSGELATGLARHHADPDGAFYGWADTWSQLDATSWTVERYLPGVAVPTLVVQGRDDQYGTLRQVAAICAGIGPLASSIVLDDCGHHPFSEQRDRMIAETVTFVDGLDL